MRQPAPDAYVPALNPRRYILQTEGKENRVLFVDGDTQFTTFYRYPNGDKKRFTAKDFTWRDTFAEAQADLDVYAANAGLMIDGAEKKCPKNLSQKQVDKFLNGIDTLLGDGRFDFAEDTLNGIRDWVAEHKHFTPAQFDAVVNIEESVKF